MTSKQTGSADRFVNHLRDMPLIRDEWSEIYYSNPRKSIFHSFEYVKNWYECFAQPDQVRIYRITADGKSIGFFPLVLHRKNGFRMLSSLTNNHCYHSGPLVRHGYDDKFKLLMTEGLIKDASSWDLLSYGCIYSFSAHSDPFPDQVLAKHGSEFKRNFQPTFTVLLDKQFNEYLQNDLSAKTRNNLKTYGKRLSQKGHIRYVHFRGVEAKHSIPEFIRLEDSGWKGAEGSSIKKCGPEYQRYYRTLIDILAENDALRLYFLEHNDKLIAGVFGYSDNGTFHYFKIAYDEEYSSFSPSHLLFIHIIEHLKTSSPDIRRVHMFPGDGGYKHRYANEDVLCEETILFSSTLRGKSLHLCSDIRKHLREVPGVLQLVSFARGLGAPHINADI